VTRVLVVEDEQSIRDALDFMLTREGYDVALAEDGVSALAQYERNGADLILLDLMLPGVSGTEVCRAIRQKSRVPIIMVTAKDTEIDKVVGLELGADDYVTKPFSTRELTARIRAVLRRGPDTEDQETGPVEVGPVRMDVDRHVVSVNGTDVALPLKEFDLLEILLRNAGRVLTRGAADRPRVGLGLRRRHQDSRRPRQAAPRQGRGGSREPRAPDHGAGTGLQVRGLRVSLRGPRPGAGSGRCPRSSPPGER
jgi:two-component system, OmpR family, response regulator RegX3